MKVFSIQEKFCPRCITSLSSIYHLFMYYTWPFKHTRATTLMDIKRSYWHTGSFLLVAQILGHGFLISLIISLGFVFEQNNLKLLFLFSFPIMHYNVRRLSWTRSQLFVLRKHFFMRMYPLFSFMSVGLAVCILTVSVYFCMVGGARGPLGQRHPLHLSYLRHLILKHPDFLHTLFNQPAWCKGEPT